MGLPVVMVRTRSNAIAGLFLVTSARGGCKPAASDQSAGVIDLVAGRTQVVVSSNACPVVKFAAVEMTNYLSRILGATVPIAMKPAGRCANVVLGINDWSRNRGVDPSPLPVDSFIIDAQAGEKGDVIFITGMDDALRDPTADMKAKRSDCGPLYERATIFGVYDFLEQYAGCRFYFPGELGEIVPRHASLTVPAKRIVETPAYEKRMWNLLVGEYVNRWFDDPSYDRRNWSEYSFRSGLQTRRSPTTGAPCHGTRFHYIKDRFGKTHPEYFRATRGKDGSVHRCVEDPWNRIGFCWTSGVTEEIYKTVKCYLTGGMPSDVGITREPNPEGYRGWHPQGFALDLADIDPEDGMTPCDCDDCRAAYKPRTVSGSADHMSRLIWGKSVEIARRLKDDGVKGRVMQIAYTGYAEPPEGIEIPDNLVVNVACNGPWSMRSDERRKKDFDLIRRWYGCTGGKKVYLHNWALKYARTNIPILPPMTPCAVGSFYREAAKYANGTYLESGSDRFAHIYLNIYVAAKTMWDPTFDIEAALDEHHRLMFGPAASEMKEFYGDLETCWIEGISGGRSEMGPFGPIIVVPSQFEIWRSIYSERMLTKWGKLFADGASKLVPGSLEMRRLELIKRNLFDELVAERRAFADKTDVGMEESRRTTRGVKNLLDKDWMADFDVPKTAFEGDWETAAAKTCVRIPFAFDKAKKYRLSYYLNLEDVTPVYGYKFCGALVAVCKGGPRGNWGYTLGASAIVGNTCGWVHVAKEFSFDQTSDPSDLVLWLRGATGKMKVKGVLLEELMEK